MADIELVIKIAEESYKEIKKIVADRNDHYFLENIIANGTPLPKGYGDLEDRPPGHWIKEGVVDVNGNRNCKCSECGHGDIQAETQIVPYCWWCGAKME